MTLLPIASRELRVASRQAGTYWTRVLAAALAVLVSGGFLAVWTASAMTAGGNTGQILFSILKWLCFAFVCSTGLFLTSDTVSEEKREGTLGLLFLTDLRGYDVVLGKLLATSLKALYGLLAFFPVLGLTLMAGGVSGTEFWRTMVGLCNALFFSLAAGVFVSTFSRDTLKAISGVMALCVIALGAPLLVDLWRADWDWSKLTPRFLAASPAYAMIVAPQRLPRPFWSALLWPHLAGWLCLALASFFVPRTWQEKSSVAWGQRKAARRHGVFSQLRRRFGWREPDPLVWLAVRDNWVTQCGRVVFLAFGGLGVYIWWRLGSRYIQGYLGVMNSLLGLVLYIWVAAQATRFLAETRRNGALELILCTPITVGQIIQGQWFALLRMTWLPMVVILALHAIQQWEVWRQLQTYFKTSTSPANSDMEIYQLLSGVTGIITFITTLVALGWFGMLMGLRARKASMALIKTFAFVQVLPWLALAILQSLMLMATVWMKIPYYFAVIAGTCLVVLKDAIFIFWSRRRVYRVFREAAALPVNVSTTPARPPAPLPVNPGVPPVLPG